MPDSFCETVVVLCDDEGIKENVGLEMRDWVAFRCKRMEYSLKFPSFLSKISMKLVSYVG